MESIISQALTESKGHKGRLYPMYTSAGKKEDSIQHSAICPSAPRDPESLFWSIMSALFSYGHPAGELPAALVNWGTLNHPAAVDHLTKSLANPPEIRRTLGAIARRMARAEDPFDQACLDEATRNDPASAGFLKPYIDRDEPGMASVDDWDRVWRGVRDDLDRRAVETWYAAMEANP